MVRSSNIVSTFLLYWKESIGKLEDSRASIQESQNPLSSENVTQQQQFF